MTPEEIENMKKQVDEMKAQIDELLAWKKAREEQQITQPIDPVSQRILKTTLGL